MEVGLVYAHLGEDAQDARPMALVGYSHTHLYPPANGIHFSLQDIQLQVLDSMHLTTLTYLFGRILYGKGVWYYWDAKHSIEYSMHSTHHFLFRNLLRSEAGRISYTYI